ncbi:MAG: polyprenyl synthetase family protein [Chlamydiae bacterium]|nr:polyprenyl synthetase family protein [Chlamydiota bacterium]
MLTQNLLSQLEDVLQEQVNDFNHSSHPMLAQAMEHVLLNPGKRIRPLLVLYTVLSLGGDVEQAMQPAAALEILHTYSLIHDDLPCMDNDDFRRGKPTLHKLYTEGQAVLIGDLLLTLAFQLLAKTPLSAEKRIQMVHVLAFRSGGKGMILGQSLDLAAEGIPLSWEQLQEIHQRKTADLISAALEFGAIIAGAEPTTQKALATVGQNIGLAFQLVDDVLDAETEENKSTSISLLGKEKTLMLAQELLSSALEACQGLQLDPSPLVTFLPKLIQRNI